MNIEDIKIGDKYRVLQRDPDSTITDQVPIKFDVRELKNEYTLLGNLLTTKLGDILAKLYMCRAADIYPTESDAWEAFLALAESESNKADEERTRKLKLYLAATNVGPTAEAPDFVHVDDFIYDILAEDTDELGAVTYARWWLLNFALPAHMQNAFKQFTKGLKLYCTYRGDRYLVVGCSRMGDVWLHSDLEAPDKRTSFYEKRVNVAECKAWSALPTIPACAG